jgi:hypothetical protein
MDDWKLPEGLPPGRFAGRLWVSEECLPDVHTRWASFLRRPALVPLLLRGFQPPAAVRRNTDIPLSLLSRNLGRPWHSGELEPADPALIDQVDPAALMERWWAQKFGPSGWQGLAPAEPAGSDPDLVATQADSSALLGGEEAFLGLVPAPDGAAALAISGWPSRRGEVIEDAALLRSWQERFGVRLCALRIDRLTVSVAWPPRSLEAARLLAAEHLAYGEDVMAYGEELDPDRLDAYAANLVDASTWEFWWD